MITTMAGSECVYEEGRRIYNTVLSDLSFADLAKVYAYALHAFGDDPHSRIVLDEIRRKQNDLEVGTSDEMDELKDRIEELEERIFDLENGDG